MGKDEFTASLRLGRRRLPPLSVPSELFDLYQPMVGPEAVMVWLNLRWLIQRGDQLTDIEKLLGQRFGMSFRDVNTALQVLIDFELLECDEDGGYILHEPLSADAFALRFRQYSVQQPPLLAFAGGYRKPRPAANVDAPAEPATTASGNEVEVEVPAVEAPSDSEPKNIPPAPETEVAEHERFAQGALSQEAIPGGGISPSQPHASPSNLPNEADAVVVSSESYGEGFDVGDPGLATSAPVASASTDLDAVVQIYHKRIGMIGPAQYEKLRFWVEEQKMDAEVVALAVEETVASAKNPRINYLEGILRNWYNAGIRTLSDLMQDKRHSQALIPKDERTRREPSPRHEGSANASAYQSVNPDLVERWKELYPDEYDE